MIVSNDGANRAAPRLGRGVVTVVPVTTNASRVYPFQVLLPAARCRLAHDAKAQAEQIRSVAVERLGEAALARAHHLGRLTARGARTARNGFEDLWSQLDRVEVTAMLAQRAGGLADQFALRGYEAVHLAAAETLTDPDLVLVAGDGELCAAAAALGLAVART